MARLVASAVAVCAIVLSGCGGSDDPTTTTQTTSTSSSPSTVPSSKPSDGPFDPSGSSTDEPETTSTESPAPEESTTSESPEESTTLDPTACAAENGQCGGQDWAGPTCCQEGLSCTADNEFYAQCTSPTTPAPDPEESTTSESPEDTTTLDPMACAAENGQCGGQDWAGPTCCQEGESCQNGEDLNIWRCTGESTTLSPVPTDLPTDAPTLDPMECAAENGQCGGQDWAGPTCCQEGESCQNGEDLNIWRCTGESTTLSPVPTDLPTDAPTEIPPDTMIEV